MKVLDIGPGINRQTFPWSGSEIVRVDLRSDVEADVLADCRKLPFDDGYFDHVYASHVLEHFVREETESTLREWLRVTKIKLRVVVPNLEWAAVQIVHGICDEFVLNAIYGRGDYSSDNHKTGFTPALLDAYARVLDCYYKVDCVRNNLILDLFKNWEAACHSKLGLQLSRSKELEELKHYSKASNAFPHFPISTKS